MEKNQIKQLFEASEKLSDVAKLQLSESHIFQLSKHISVNAHIAQLVSKFDFSHLVDGLVKSSLQNIDFSYFAKAIEASIPKFDFTPFHISQIQEMQNFGSLIAENHSSNLSQIRANAFLSSAFLEQIKGITNLQQTFAVQLAESLDII